MMQVCDMKEIYQNMLSLWKRKCGQIDDRMDVQGNAITPAPSKIKNGFQRIIL